MLKVYKKTYCVEGMLDYVAQVSADGITLDLHFKGGIISQYGVVPAHYTTDNPLIQRVIEKSEGFTRGRIKLLEQEEIALPSSKEDSVTAATPEEETVVPLDKVEVGSLADARLYLEEHFGVAPSSVHTKAQIKNAAAANGIEFAGI